MITNVDDVHFPSFLRPHDDNHVVEFIDILLLIIFLPKCLSFDNIQKLSYWWMYFDAWATLRHDAEL